MARDGAVYACQSCGAVSTKWSGQCPACQSWNSLVEEVGVRAPGALSSTKATRVRGLQFTGLGTASFEGHEVAMPNEYDEVYNLGVAKGDPRLCSAETGAALTEKLTDICARFIAHFASKVSA